MADTRLTHALEAYEARLTLVNPGTDPKVIKLKKALYGAMWFIEHVRDREGDPDAWADYQELRALAKEAQHG